MGEMRKGGIEGVRGIEGREGDVGIEERGEEKEEGLKEYEKEE